MKRRYGLFLCVLVLLAGCGSFPGYGEHSDVGMLIETTADDQGFGERGYEGLQMIEQEFDADVYYKENIKTYDQTAAAVEDLVHKGVDIIFGHGNIYESHFKELHASFPDVEFVYFNGEFSADNVTSLNFSSRAMGFFAGMVAGEMTKSDKIGLIGAFEWQPELEGFYEGVLYQNPEADVSVSLTNSWSDTQTALGIYSTMQRNGADVFYPAGDLFDISIIKQAEQDGKYAIGYVKDRSSVAENAVLTSTIQRIDEVYELVMERYVDGNLTGGSLTFDFQEGAIEMGTYSSDVPVGFQKEMDEAVAYYEETGELPNR
ncbi:BMP family ABC transporter substrate-binding protein [Halobacillus sp. KGW1]|uniref:BMP family ABC transporter substrate-binding protein n=1 Tax=Halobacillus sp. KGW1 TaxID=1793726 RepID=UPI000783FCF3|nr:BMP family ABC transporter substrate-binding protein [Halobacillus sp. KGW1]